MKRLLSILLFTGIVAASLSFIDRPASVNKIHDQQNLIEPDTVFLAEAASSSMMEIQLGELAQQKAATADVKRFGAMMVKDHTAASKELKDVASRLNFTVPDTMLRKHSRHVRHLDGLSGAAFDKEYMKMMVEAHKDDIDEFEDAAKKAANESVKQFAAKQLPILKMHRDSATAIRKRIR